MKLKEQLIGMAEVMNGRPLSDAGAAIMVAALAKHPPAHVRTALARVASECRRLTLPEVLERLPGAAPAAEEAWAICSGAYDEANTVVWTEAMARSFGQVRHMSDRVAARMAFREIYMRERAEDPPMPKWSPSMGMDPGRRDAAIRAGIEAGRLPGSPESYGLLPAGHIEPKARALPSGEPLAQGELAALSGKVLADLRGEA